MSVGYWCYQECLSAIASVNHECLYAIISVTDYIVRLIMSWMKSVAYPGGFSGCPETPPDMIF